MRVRFSLRTLFIVASIAALACYWLMVPTINAQCFVRAVKAEDYARADDYFRNPDDRFLWQWYDKHWRFKAWAKLESCSFGEIMRGQRRIVLGVAFGDAGPMRSANWTVTATRGGLLSPEPSFSGGSFGGGGIL